MTMTSCTQLLRSYKPSIRNRQFLQFAGTNKSDRVRKCFYPKTSVSKKYLHSNDLKLGSASLQMHISLHAALQHTQSKICAVENRTWRATPSIRHDYNHGTRLSLLMYRNSTTNPPLHPHPHHRSSHLHTPQP